MSFAADPPPAAPPEGGVAVLATNALDQAADRDPDAFLRLSRVTVDDGPAPAALQADTLKEPAEIWSAQLVFKNERPIAAGSTLFLTFALRTLSSSQETGEGVSEVVFEQATDPHEKAIAIPLSAGRDWTLFQFPFRTERAYALGEAQLCFRLGFRPQSIQFAALRLLDFGPDLAPDRLPRTRLTYDGREPDAAWRHEAAARIEAHRKGPLTLRLQDPDGAPLPNVPLELAMTRLRFGFGSAVVAHHLADGSGSDDSRRYRKIVEDWFTIVVFENDLKWPNWIQAETLPTTRAAVRWLRDRDIPIRGHCLIWPSWRYSPKHLRAWESDPAELRRACEERVRHTVSSLKEDLQDWDVINEPTHNHDLLDILGRDAMIDWFKFAAEEDPDCRLFLNDFGALTQESVRSGHRDDFLRNIAFLQKGGAPLGGIGLQCHFGARPPDIEFVQRELERFAAVGLPLVVTEFDVDTKDEALHGDFTRDFLTLCFSHPAVTDFLSWGFWEGQHWRPAGAYYRRDWSLKPAGEAWQALLRAWRTEANGHTNAEGSFTVPAFYGRYRLTIGAGPHARTVDIDHAPGAPPRTVTWSPNGG